LAYAVDALDDATLEALRANPDVLAVEEDGLYTIQAAQTDATGDLHI
jgi:hypothetical protein